MSLDESANEYSDTLYSTHDGPQVCAQSASQSEIQYSLLIARNICKKRITFSRSQIYCFDLFHVLI